MSKNYSEMYEQLEFTDDFMFCKILENNPDLCKELIEVILNIKIRKVERVSKQKELKLKAEGKGVRFDVYLEDADNSVFDIEMQTTKKKDLPKRSRYYQSMIDMDMIQKRANYSELKESYVIFICTKDPFESNLPVYHFENVCLGNKDLLLKDEAIKVFVNAKGVRENISEEMKAFLDFLEDKQANSRLTKRLQEEVEHAKRQEEWRHEYMFLEEIYEEKFKEGIKEGSAILIRKLYAKKMSVEQIAELVDMTETEVKQILELE